jgi:hypothetical protein
VQSGHKDVYWFEYERPYVQWVSLRFVLTCTGVLVVEVASFLREGADSRSLEWWWWCVVSIEVDSSCCCLIVSSFLGVVPALSFITYKGRAHVTFAVKW